MEKLSLEKFKNEEIGKIGMMKITAGDTCTGGGFENNWQVDGNSYVLASTYSWTSDTIFSDGSTHKYGFKVKYFLH